MSVMQSYQHEQSLFHFEGNCCENKLGWGRKFPWNFFLIFLLQAASTRTTTKDVHLKCMLKVATSHCSFDACLFSLR